ncbi:MAG: Arm DNA-binding domain-containing protein, partial [Alphaproteobacteria bacterium]|nr:Arm DNA-binding domain-containing protein [Alphaproteobacteria bacterium]
MALSIKKIAKATKRGRYADGHNLYLQVNRRGTKSWLLRYVRNGRERWMGLGPLHTLTLEEARTRATAARQRLLDGNDPLADRQAHRAARALEAVKTKTFAETAREYFVAHERKWKNVKHRQQFLATLERYAFAVIGELPVSEIDTGLVLNVIKPIWM